MMIPKIFKLSALSLLVFISLNPACRADQGETESGYLSTGTTGTLSGTAPVIQNAKGNKGKVNVAKISEHDASDELDEGDVVKLAWQLQDSEGDADSTLASIVWTCNHPTKGTRVLATQVSSYTISSADYGCNIGVAIQPQTVTGIPQTGEQMTIPDISANEDTDNIIEGPVNPHSINFIDYIVAPDTTQSETVSANMILHTGFAGAKVQLETDNPESQIIWASSNQSVATVTQEGVVTFLKKGPVTIQARNDKAIARIKFDPKEFFIFTPTNMNWYEAKEWCESQGYTMPPSVHLSTKANFREIPSDAIWQEWGNVSVQDAQMGASVVWSSSEWAYEENAYYLYFSDGHITSNSETTKEGVICEE